MKKQMVITAMALFAAALNAKPLAEAKGSVDSVIANPDKMTAEMKSLSAADQKDFLAYVNEAICNLPASAEEKSAKSLNVNRAALAGAATKNTEALLAEMFATAPLESLVQLNESLAKDALNRAADPAKVYTDDQFAQAAKSLVCAVTNRVAGLEDADVRGGFAALTMIRASNGTPASLANDLAALLGDSAEVAKAEWFPEALSEAKNYDPMLAGTKVEKAPDTDIVLVIAGAQRHESLLGALYADDDSQLIIKGLGDMSQIQSFDNDIYTRPRTMADEPWNPDLPVKPEPRPYDYQSYK